VKQLVVLSGKGGTGKTTTLASFAALSGSSILADCDVDAANLHLLLSPHVRRQGDFQGAKLVHRDVDKCTRCGACERGCRFDAITTESIAEAHCEGCGLCVLLCPEEALRLEPHTNGTWYESMTRYGPLVHAVLRPGGENSGRLVYEVRNRAERLAQGRGVSSVLLDGPPGIGCTVIASVVDTDLAVMVTEPTLSARHDLERVVELARGFSVPVAVIVNKADINPAQVTQLREYCGREELPLLAELPYDADVMAANAEQTPLVLYSQGPAATGLREAWQKARELLGLDCS
jgi:MinD superfamily P-loop ATPase